MESVGSSAANPSLGAALLAGSAVCTAGRRGWAKLIQASNAAAGGLRDMLDSSEFGQYNFAMGCNEEGSWPRSETRQRAVGA